MSDRQSSSVFVVSVVASLVAGFSGMGVSIGLICLGVGVGMYCAYRYLNSPQGGNEHKQ
jgi:hypothetical protein